MRRRSWALALSVLALRTRRTELAPVSRKAAWLAVSEARVSQGISSAAGSAGAARTGLLGKFRTGASGEALLDLAGPGGGVGFPEVGLEIGEGGQGFCGGGEVPVPVTMVGSEGETPVAARLRRGISASGGGAIGSCVKDARASATPAGFW